MTKQINRTEVVYTNHINNSCLSIVTKDNKQTFLVLNNMSETVYQGNSFTSALVAFKSIN